MVHDRFDNNQLLSQFEDRKTVDDWRYLPLDDDGSPPAGSWDGYEQGPDDAIVALGSLCHLRGSQSDYLGRHSISIGIEEFAVLSNDCRILIRADRGAGLGWVGDPRLTDEDVRDAVCGALLPDEGEVLDAGEARPWHELADILSERGMAVSAEILKGLPYRIEFDRALRDRLTPTPATTSTVTRSSTRSGL